MDTKNYNDSNQEIELIHVLNILIKRKWFIIIPTFIITLLGVIYYIFRPEIIKSEMIINTKNMVEIISLIDKDTKQFSMVHYNNFIRPVNNMLENEKQIYSIEVGERDSFKITKLDEHKIYSLIITNWFSKKKSKDKEIYEKIINDFIKKLELKIFKNYFFRRNQEKFDLQKDIIRSKVLIESENKKITIIEKYLNLDEKKFIDITVSSDTFLPPYQQYIGLRIKRDFEQIRLAKLINDLTEIDEEISIIKNKKISDFLSLLEIERMKNFKFYNNLKIYPEKFILLKQQILKSIVFSPEKYSIIKFTLLSFILTLCLFILLSFVREWWKVNKTNLKI